MSEATTPELGRDEAAEVTHIGAHGRQRTNTAAATEAVQQYAAERAVDDPVKLARAARIVRAALARRVLTIEDLQAGGPDAA